MKKSAIIRPVSNKAYMRFVERICIVVTDRAKCNAMLAALDSYLEGNRDTYDSELTPDCVMVFGILRFEIDLAMARSAKARMRARRHEKPSDTLKNVSAKNVKSDGNDMTAKVENAVTTETDTTGSMPHLFSRRARRAAARRATPKTRWSKPGGGNQR
ncbi:MAG: hypothetical protein K2I24_06995 [Duncaniella sp.]|nr:hypothetical protein [Duncaniella sp.]